MLGKKWSSTLQLVILSVKWIKTYVNSNCCIIFCHSGNRIMVKVHWYYSPTSQLDCVLHTVGNVLKTWSWLNQSITLEKNNIFAGLTFHVYCLRKDQATRLLQILWLPFPLHFQQQFQLPGRNYAWFLAPCSFLSRLQSLLSG